MTMKVLALFIGIEEIYIYKLDALNRSDLLLRDFSLGFSDCKHLCIFFNHKHYKLCKLHVQIIMFKADKKKIYTLKKQRPF